MVGQRESPWRLHQLTSRHGVPLFAPSFPMEHAKLPRVLRQFSGALFDAGGCVEYLNHVLDKGSYLVLDSAQNRIRFVSLRFRGKHGDVLVVASIAPDTGEHSLHDDRREREQRCREPSADRVPSLQGLNFSAVFALPTSSVERSRHQCSCRAPLQSPSSCRDGRQRGNAPVFGPAGIAK